MYNCNVIYSYNLTRQKVVTQPVQSPTNDSPTFPTNHSGAPLLKLDDDIDDIDDDFEYPVDKPEVNNQVIIF